MKKFVILIFLAGLTQWSCVKDEDALTIIPPSPRNDGGTTLNYPNPIHSKGFTTTKFTV